MKAPCANSSCVSVASCSSVASAKTSTPGHAPCSIAAGSCTARIACTVLPRDPRRVSGVSAGLGTKVSPVGVGSLSMRSTRNTRAACLKRHHALKDQVSSAASYQNPMGSTQRCVRAPFASR